MNIIVLLVKEHYNSLSEDEARVLNEMALKSTFTARIRKELKQAPNLYLGITQEKFIKRIVKIKEEERRKYNCTVIWVPVVAIVIAWIFSKWIG